MCEIIRTFWFTQVIISLSPQWGNEWRTISKDRSGSRCFYPVMMARTEDKIILSFGFMAPRQVGPYRCVLDGPNVTAPEYTEPLNGDDWILPSGVLTLNNVSALDEGRYTCTTSHPTISSLSRNRTITLSVLKWDLDGNTETILITAGASVACLAIILSMTAFFCFCGKKIKTSKGPIDDHSAKKPIYKSSVESVPSTCGDQQPLV
uniref:Ig-like domain-containing protein n=1 Tax=Periophthalmus magnuspinnatus TaxID=409849 RepID=A0A3B3ZA86_9GOBI